MQVLEYCEANILSIGLTLVYAKIINELTNDSRRKEKN